MSIGARFRLFLLAPLLCTAGLYAQQNVPSTSAPASKIDLDVVVTPKSGPPVADLQQQDFTLLDNKTPKHITSFKAINGSQDPVHVILVIDAVNSPYERIAYERGEIDKFLRANGGRLAQPVALAFVTDSGAQVQKAFSTDGNELTSSLDDHAIGLRDVRRSSQYQGIDRFQLSMNALQEIAGNAAKLPGRKMIFWVSPGWPLLSGPGIQFSG